MGFWKGKNEMGFQTEAPYHIEAESVADIKCTWDDLCNRTFGKPTNMLAEFLPGHFLSWPNDFSWWLQSCYAKQVKQNNFY